MTRGKVRKKKIAKFGRLEERNSRGEAGIN